MKTVLTALAATAIVAAAAGTASAAPQHRGHWVTDYHATGAAMVNGWDMNTVSCGTCCTGGTFAKHYTIRAKRSVMLLHTDGYYQTPAGFAPEGACPNRQSPVQFLYGKFTARVQFPGNTAGAFDWPADWMVNESNWPTSGEIDVAEVNGWPSGAGGHICASYHYGPKNPPTAPHGYVVSTCDKRAADAAGWHTYTIVWKPGLIKYYVDGRQYATHRGAHIPSLAENVVFDVTNVKASGVPDTVRVAWFTHQHWSSS